MESKIFEIRDAATCIYVLVTPAKSSNPVEALILRTCGYGPKPLYIVTRLRDMRSSYDPYQWGAGSRTMQIAHDYIEYHFNDLTTGAVIDVQYILGETKEPKISELLESR